MPAAPGQHDGGNRRLAFHLPQLAGGGAERVTLALAGHFAAAGWRVDLVLCRPGGGLEGAVPDGVRVVMLNAPGSMRSVPCLTRYLRACRPDILVASLGHTNLAALLAGRLARAGTALIVCQHNALSAECGAGRPLRFRLLPAGYRLLLPLADAVVAVSDGVARELERLCARPPGSVRTIHNPAWSAAQQRAAEAASADDPWLAPGQPPVVLGVGRLTAQKDFATLIKAFVRARAAGVSARLLILGDGPERARLDALIRASGQAETIRLAGYRAAPLGFMARAALLVLSSRYEGFGNVLVEALGCGTPVVSTDCPYGPAEILAGGRYGRLVPVGDAPAMADAIRATLAAPCDRPALRRRAAAFGLAAAAAGYARLFEELRPRAVAQQV